MVEQFEAESITEMNFKLLSVASLLKKIKNGITVEELHRDTERKFDTLIELLNDTITDKSILSKFGYSLDDLKQMSYSIFNRLISDDRSNPYMILCISEGTPLEEIKRRRNKLLHVFHPDRNQDELSSGEKTIKINEAYEKILHIYNSTEIRCNNMQTNVPYYDPHKKKMRFTLVTLFVVSLLIFLVFMKRYYFF